MLKTDLIFRHIKRTPELAKFLREKIEPMVDSFLKPNDRSHLTIRVDTERGRGEHRKPSFTCEVAVKVPHSRRMIFVRKQAESLREAVSMTNTALKRTLRRFVSRVEATRHGRRHDLA